MLCVLLPAIARGVPDAVVTDVILPDADGLALLRALRADPKTAAVPVVVTTALPGLTLTPEDEAAGPVTLLAKPCKGEEIEAALVALAERAKGV